MHGFWADLESLIFWVWAASAAGETLPKGGAVRALPFERVFRAAGAAQTPQNSTISGRPQNHVLNNLAYNSRLTSNIRQPLLLTTTKHHGLMLKRYSEACTAKCGLYWWLSFLNNVLEVPDGFSRRPSLIRPSPTSRQALDGFGRTFGYP